MAQDVRTDTPRGTCIGCHRASRPRRKTCSQACADRVRTDLMDQLDALVLLGQGGPRALERELKVLEGLRL